MFMLPAYFLLLSIALRIEFSFFLFNIQTNRVASLKLPLFHVRFRRLRTTRSPASVEASELFARTAVVLVLPLCVHTHVGIGKERTPSQT